MTKRVEPTKKALVAAGHLSVLIEWTCPQCKGNHATSIDFGDITEGCQGHGPGEYCYCARREYREHLECPVCDQEVEVYAFP